MPVNTPINISIVRLITVILLAALLWLPFVSPVQARDGVWDAELISARGDIRSQFVDMRLNVRGIDLLSGLSGKNEVSGVKAAKILGVNTKGVTLRTTKLTEINVTGNSSINPVTNGVAFGDKWIAGWYPWVVRIKLQQSLSRSEWVVVAGYDRFGRGKQLRVSATALGTQAQEFIINMGPARALYKNLKVITTTPGNDITIDSIRVESLSARQFMRANVRIDGKPVSGSIALVTNSHYRLFVNGRLVSEKSGRPPFHRRVNKIDDVSAFRSGDNVIAVETERYGGFSRPGGKSDGHLVLQGIIYTDTGSVAHIATDKNWKGIYDSQAGWMAADYDDSAWPSVKVDGSLHEPLWGKAKHIFGDFAPTLPYMGRIEVQPDGRKYPIYLDNETGRFRVSVPPVKSASEQLLEYKLEDARSNATLASGVIPLTANDSNHLTADLVIKGVGIGPKNIVLSYVVDGKVQDIRRYETVIAGGIVQQYSAGADITDGLELTAVKSISVADVLHDKRGIFGELGTSNKMDGMRSLGKKLILEDTGSFQGEVVASPNRQGSWFSVRYDGLIPYRPHIAWVRYPADENLNQVIVVAESSAESNVQNIGTYGGVPRSVVGLHTDGDARSSEGLRTIPVLFWPNRSDGTITIVNAGQSRQHKASVGDIRIDRVEGQMPSVIRGSGGAGPMIGPFTERVDRTTPRIFYSGEMAERFSFDLVDGGFEGYYAQWYKTIENLILYLRFTGQNTYFAGIYMYNGGWFPSEKFQGNAEDGLDYQGAGWDCGAIPLMARMFEANGLNLVLGVQFFGSPALINRDVVTDSDVHVGKYTSRFVTANGIQAKGEGGFNFLAPEVRDEILMLAGTISDLYKSYPAIKGITWLRTPEFPVAVNDSESATELEVGYGDVTIELFARETGVTVRAPSGGRDRFRERYEWIMKNAKEEWLHWRAAKVYELDSKILEEIRSRRPDWKMWRLTTWPKAGSLSLWADGKIDYDDIYRYQGFDVTMYSDPQGVRLVPTYDFTGGRIWRDKRGKPRVADAVDSFNLAMGRDAYQNFGAFIQIGFMIERTLSTEQEWPWQRLQVVSSSAPEQDVFVTDVKELIAGPTSEIVPIGWSDVNHFMGHEEAIRSVSHWLDERARLTR